jgi:hypothetical protein
LDAVGGELIQGLHGLEGVQRLLIDGPVVEVLDKGVLLGEGLRRPGQIAGDARLVVGCQAAIPTWIVAVLPAVVAEQWIVPVPAVAKPGVESAIEVAGPVVIAEIVATPRRAAEQGRQQTAEGQAIARLIIPVRVRPERAGKAHRGEQQAAVL